MKWQKEKLRKQSHSNCTKNNKILGINLTKEVRDLYSENCKTFKKEIEEDTNGKILHAHGFEEQILLKYPH